MFAGIVYTQALRIRRIVSIDERLAVQLDALADAFKKCKYPRKLVDDIVGKVKNLPRTLRRNDDSMHNNINDNDVIMVSTHGADKPLQDIVENLPNKNKLSIKKVYKTASSLVQKLCTPRRTCIGSPKGVSAKCNRNRCLCCNLMSQNDKVTSLSGKTYKTANGNCTSKIVLYHLKCKLCGQPYVGKTVQMASSRMCGHRQKFFELIRQNGEISEDADKDEYALGMHLYKDHGLQDFEHFNSSYELTLLEKCTPSSLDMKEHFWIQKLRTLNPFGLNSVDPYGLPLLH